MRSNPKTAMIIFRYQRLKTVPYNKNRDEKSKIFCQIDDAIIVMFLYIA